VTSSSWKSPSKLIPKLPPNSNLNTKNSPSDDISKLTNPKKSYNNFTVMNTTHQIEASLSAQPGKYLNRRKG
jgi:hypothetical protein